MHAVQNITLFSPPSTSTEYRFFWRGQSDVGWGLQPRLFRNLRERLGHDPTLAEFNAREDEILAAFDKTQLGNGLHVLEKLALLQHHGAPTRLLDVSTDFLPALYFACEDGLGTTPKDGLLLAFLASPAPGAFTPDSRSLPNNRKARSYLNANTRYYEPAP